MNLSDFLTEEDKKFRKFLFLDRNKLDKSLENHSVHIYDINMLLAEVESKLDEQKDEIAKVEAGIVRSIKHKAKLDNEKISEKDVERQLIRYTSVQKVREKYRETKKIYNQLMAKKSALLERSKMIVKSCEYFKTEVIAGSREKK